MSAQVLTNAKVWFAGYDMSGDLNKIALKYGVDAKESTTFGSGGFKTRLPGLQGFSFAHEGLWSGGAGNVDDEVFNQIFAVRNTVLSIDPVAAGAEGDEAYTGEVDVADYAPGAKVGEIFTFSLAGDSDGDPLVRGTLGANRIVTASGNGPGYNLGAVGAAQKVYAALHVLASVQGTLPTLNVVVQSAPDNTFAAPTPRISFAQASAAGAQWLSAAGAITDAWWRVNYTVGGTTPSFPFVVVVGIR